MFSAGQVLLHAGEVFLAGGAAHLVDPLHVGGVVGDEPDVEGLVRVDGNDGAFLFTLRDVCV